MDDDKRMNGELLEEVLCFTYLRSNVVVDGRKNRRKVEVKNE